MNILVTGGAGFIGSHLIDRLLTEENEEYIKQELARGVTKVQIAKDLGVLQGHLYVFLKVHPEVKPDFEGANHA